MQLKKRDIFLLALAAFILIFLWNAPPETTSHVPYDETHRRFYDMVAAEGKKEAEKFCQECHNDEQVPFPDDHPTKARCLFCHKLDRN